MMTTAADDVGLLFSPPGGGKKRASGNPASLGGGVASSPLAGFGTASPFSSPGAAAFNISGVSQLSAAAGHAADPFNLFAAGNDVDDDDSDSSGPPVPSMSAAGAFPGGAHATTTDASLRPRPSPGPFHSRSPRRSSSGLSPGGGGVGAPSPTNPHQHLHQHAPPSFMLASNSASVNASGSINMASSVSGVIGNLRGNASGSGIINMFSPPQAQQHDAQKQLSNSILGSQLDESIAVDANDTFFRIGGGNAGVGSSDRASAGADSKDTHNITSVPLHSTSMAHDINKAYALNSFTQSPTKIPVAVSSITSPIGASNAGSSHANTATPSKLASPTATTAASATSSAFPSPDDRFKFDMLEENYELSFGSATSNADASGILGLKNKGKNADSASKFKKPSKILTSKSEAISSSSNAADKQQRHVTKKTAVNDAASKVPQTPSGTQAGAGRDEIPSSSKSEKKFSDMGLRQRERALDELKRENFSLKLRLFYLEERLEKSSPMNVLKTMKENAEYLAVIEELRTELNQRQAEYENLKAEYERIHEHAEMVESEVEGIHKDFNDAHSALEHTKAELNLIRQANNDLESQLSSLTARLDEAERVAAEYKGQIVNLESAHEKLASANASLEKRNAELDEAVADLQTQFESAQSENHILRAEFEEKYNNLVRTQTEKGDQALSEVTQQLENIIEEKTATNSRLTSENQRLSTENKRLKEQIEMTMRERDDFKAEAEDMKVALEQNQRDQLETQSEQSSALARVRQELAEFKAQYRELERSKHGGEREMEELHQTLSAQLDSLKNELDQAISERDRIADALTRSEYEARHANERTAKTEKKLEAHATKLQQLHESVQILSVERDNAVQAAETMRSQVKGLRKELSRTKKRTSQSGESDPEDERQSRRSRSPRSPRRPGSREGGSARRSSRGPSAGAGANDESLSSIVAQTTKSMIELQRQHDLERSQLLEENDALRRNLRAMANENANTSLELSDDLAFIKQKLNQQTDALAVKEDDLYRLRNQMETMRLEARDYEQRIRELENEVNRQHHLLIQKEQIEASENEWAERYKSTLAELEHLRRESSHVKAEFERTLSDFRVLKTQHEETVRDMERLHAEKSDVIDAKELKEREFRALKEQVFDLRVRASRALDLKIPLSLESKLTKFDIDTIENGIIDLQNQIKILNANLDDKKTDKHGLQRQLENQAMSHAQSLDAIKEKWTKETEQLRDTIAKLKDDLKTARDQIDNLRNQLATKDTQEYFSKSMNETTQRLQTELSDARAEVVRLKGELERALTDRDGVARLQSDNEMRLKEEVEHRITEAEHYRLQVEEMTDRIASLEQELRQRIDELASVQTDNNDLLNTVNELQEIVEIRGAEVDSAQKNFKRLEQKLKGLEVSLELKESETLENSDQMNRLSSKIDNLQRNFALQSKELQDTKERYQIREREYRNLGDELYKMRDHEQQLIEKIARLETVVKRKESELTMLKAQLEDSTDEQPAGSVPKLQRQLERVSAELASLQSDYDVAMADLEKSRSSQRTLQKKVLGLEQDILDKNAEFSKLQMQVSSANERTKDLEAKLAKEHELRLKDVARLSDLGNEKERVDIVVEKERQRARRILDEEKKKWQKNAEEEEARLKRIIDDVEKRLSSSQDKVHELNLELRTKVSEIQALERQLDRSAALIEGDANNLMNAYQQLNEDYGAMREELEAYRQEVAVQREDLDKKDKSLNQTMEAMDRLAAQNRKLMEQLGHHARNGEDLIDLQTSLSERDLKIKELKKKVSELALAVNKEEELNMVSEKQHKEQVNERNRLLLIIYEFLESILSRKSGPVDVSADMKLASSSFHTFSEKMLSRVRMVSKICKSFDERAKVIEQKGMKEFRILSTKLETRLKQLEKFESIVRTACAYQKKLKETSSRKQKELDIEKTRVAQLTTQIATLKADLEAARRNFETDRRTSTSRGKSDGVADSTKLKEMEEKVGELEQTIQLEREGASARVTELVSSVTRLENQIEMLTKRNRQMSELVKNSSSSIDLFDNGNKQKEELRRDLASDRVVLERERDKYRKQYDALLGEYEKLKARLAKRERVITKALGRLDTVRDRKETIEAAILREAADDVQIYLQDTSRNVSIDGIDVRAGRERGRGRR